MTTGLRNSFSYQNWTLEKVSSRFDLSRIDCGDEDLNDYFRNDAALFREELLSLITVDAYRRAVGFYEHNDFARMLTKETEEPDTPTVPLFFDLKRLQTQAA